ncbi:hypothetical protein [Lonsdalea iberica]|uniref:hypothetical protein n=1 Tax=Lonsdalea iberica TaxID=1082703 RepID=UPI00111BD874|nr:hypothetical protein [Lonsdalea iberica]
MAARSKHDGSTGSSQDGLAWKRREVVMTALSLNRSTEDPDINALTVQGVLLAIANKYVFIY